VCSEGRQPQTIIVPRDPRAAATIQGRQTCKGIRHLPTQLQLLRSGNRFGVYIRRVEPRRIPCRPPTCDPTTVRLLLYFVWFPKDFYPPLERPTNFVDVREALKLDPDDNPE
jgi:hypothetical protein